MLSCSVMSDSVNPWDCSPPGSSVYGILQARILEWVPCPPPGDLPDPEIESRCPALQADSLMSVIWLLSHVHLFVTPWTAACQASLSSTISWSLLKLMSTELGVPSNHLILFCPLPSCLQSFPASLLQTSRAPPQNAVRSQGET